VEIYNHRNVTSVELPSHQFDYNMNKDDRMKLQEEAANIKGLCDAAGIPSL
jgi:hypothetical protein